jgi:hypothetical protein
MLFSWFCEKMVHLVIIHSFNHDICDEIKLQFNFFQNEDLKSNERSELTV